MDTIEKLIELKKQVYRICNALVTIVDYECCDYGFSVEVDMAEEFIKKYGMEDKNES